MSKYRRNNRRILNNARRNRVRDTKLRESSIKKTYLVLLCVVVAGFLMMLTTSNLPDTTQKQIAYVCNHDFSVGSLTIPEPELLSGVLNREGINDYANVGTRVYIYDNTHTFSSYEINDNEDTRSLHTNNTTNNERADGAELIIVDNNNYNYRPNVMSTIVDPIAPLSMFDEDEESNEGYTLIIMVIGEDGMAVGLQNGELLSINPMMPYGETYEEIDEEAYEETYEVVELLGGERFVFSAGPDDEDHFVNWTAYLTDDITQNLSLSLEISEPPVSTCIFIMPKADVTIVIEFTQERPKYLDFALVNSQPVLDVMLPEESILPTEEHSW